MQFRRAKIVCTLGPACDEPEVLGKMLEAGLDVARFNFSHGSHADHAARLTRLRDASKKAKKAVAALQDLCGPKIRTGRFPAPFELVDGTDVTLVEGDKTTSEREIPIQYEGLAADVRVGDRVMFDDGKVHVRVLSVVGDAIQGKVEQGGGMRNNVGVHLPTRTMRIGPLTDKDKEDLIFGLSQGMDYIALSFVRRAEDVKLVREIAEEWGQPTPIVAKIETPDAIENLESIVLASDAVMVARGDLGVEFPPERVPVIQRQIIGVARRVRRPVIVATEMLQSMTQATRPTRAEASDVANAVFGGTDAVMLSGETASGEHPVLATSMMSRIALEAEQSTFFDHNPPYAAGRATGIPEAVARGACNSARDIGAKFLVAFTQSGSSALHVSLARSPVPVIAYSQMQRTRRRMALYWNVLPREMPPLQDIDGLVNWANGDLLGSGLASPGERIVIVFGSPIGVSGSTNTIRVHVVG
ncbi:MAG: pyruvate kinase [Myxococcales bacterium]|nr:pyruvate kinase [Myxococcales bacterium]